MSFRRAVSWADASHSFSQSGYNTTGAGTQGDYRKKNGKLHLSRKAECSDAVCRFWMNFSNHFGPAMGIQQQAAEVRAAAGLPQSRVWQEKETGPAIREIAGPVFRKSISAANRHQRRIVKLLSRLIRLRLERRLRCRLRSSAVSDRRLLSR